MTLQKIHTDKEYSEVFDMHRWILSKSKTFSVNYKKTVVARPSHNLDVKNSENFEGLVPKNGKKQESDKVDGKHKFPQSKKISCEEDQLNNSYVGIIVSKKISKKAVVRNKIKRRLREIARQNQDLFKGYKIVIVARRGIEKKKFWDLNDEFVETVKLIKERTKFINPNPFGGKMNFDAESHGGRFGKKREKFYRDGSKHSNFSGSDHVDFDNSFDFDGKRNAENSFESRNLHNPKGFYKGKVYKKKAADYQTVSK